MIIIVLCDVSAASSQEGEGGEEGEEEGATEEVVVLKLSDGILQAYIAAEGLRLHLVRLSHTQTGCSIGSKTLLAKRGKLPLKFTCATGTSTCPTTLLN